MYICIFVFKGFLVFLQTCLNNEREARFPCFYMYNIFDMPEATYISLCLRAASVWLRHLASGLRHSLLLDESEQLETKLPL